MILLYRIKDVIASAFDEIFTKEAVHARVFPVVVRKLVFKGVSFLPKVNSVLSFGSLRCFEDYSWSFVLAINSLGWTVGV